MDIKIIINLKNGPITFRTDCFWNFTDKNIVLLNQIKLTHKTTQRQLQQILNFS